jgi:hypothetical protein
MHEHEAPEQLADDTAELEMSASSAHVQIVYSMQNAMQLCAAYQALRSEVVAFCRVQKSPHRLWLSVSRCARWHKDVLVEHNVVPSARLVLVVRLIIC